MLHVEGLISHLLTNGEDVHASKNFGLIAFNVLQSHATNTARARKHNFLASNAMLVWLRIPRNSGYDLQAYLCQEYHLLRARVSLRVPSTMIDQVDAIIQGAYRGIEMITGSEDLILRIHDHTQALYSLYRCKSSCVAHLLVLGVWETGKHSHWRKRTCGGYNESFFLGPLRNNKQEIGKWQIH